MAGSGRYRSIPLIAVLAAGLGLGYVLFGSGGGPESAPITPTDRTPPGGMAAAIEAPPPSGVHVAPAPALEGSKKDDEPRTAPPPLPDGTVSFDVKPASGEVPLAVVIQWWKEGADPTRPRGQSWTVEQPTVQFKPGAYHVYAVAGVDKEWKSQVEPIEVAAGRPIGTVVLRLAERSGLIGHVVFPEPVTSNSLEVCALRTAGAAPPDWDPRMQPGLRLRVDREPPYAFSAYELDPGWYVVAALLDGRRIAVQAMIYVERGLARVDLVIPPFEPAKYLVLHVTGPDGNPVEDAQISTGLRAPRVSAIGGGNIVRRADGSWYVEHNPAAPAGTEGTWTVHVRSPRYGEREQVYEPGRDREVKVAFGEPATLDVEFDDYATSPLARSLRVALKPAPEIDRNVYGNQVSVGEKGRVAFGTVQPGAYVVLLIDHGVFVRLPVRVASGDNLVRLRLPALYPLEVRCARPEEHLRFGLTRLDPEGEWVVDYTEADASGVLRFPRLPEGRYELFGRYAGVDRKVVVEVPSQSSVTFD